MDTQNVQQEEAESDTVTYLRRGDLISSMPSP